MSMASQRRTLDRIVANLGRLERGIECPRDLLELERSALANAALVGVRESSGVDEHRRETWRIETRQRARRVRAVRKALRADPAVAPRLLHDPGAAVVAILSVAEILDVLALRVPSAAAVLKHHCVTVARVDVRDLLARVAPGLARLAVRRALQNDRRAFRQRLAVPRRQIDVRCQPHAIAHRDHDVALNDDFELSSRRVREASRRHGQNGRQLQKLQSEFATVDQSHVAG